ncbi:glutamate--tRNA ligase [Inhella sp.]|uniref:glutamate--tRNA ligase n=1 Tax=Inhella sp. TaxID=1921806 RepID=UPI0035B3E067
MIRTRIAPSPTGFLHLGTARTALYSWAFARHHGGQFVLRIEDTDVARSTQDSVDQILAAMHWLGLDYDEGPVYQMQRLERYQQVAEQLLAAGLAYRCYCTPAELDAMREAQKARGDKTRYDGRWRPESGKTLPNVPTDVKPVIRFKNPMDGEVVWDDLVKGEIRIGNREIDDLILVRPDGVPTYNFAVVVDDWDMRISHVFRGDEHINNTPWQINLFQALGAPLPRYGHLPIILGDDGQKLSKRRGAVSVTAYEDAGYLPEAMLNYLARLGWSHGDDELFSREQMVSWFDGSHLSKSPAQWDPAKLAWVNAQYLKAADNTRLAGLVTPRLVQCGVSGVSTESLAHQCALVKDRCSTLEQMAEWISMFYVQPSISDEDRAQHLTESAQAACVALASALNDVEWTAPTIAAAMKSVLADRGMKMPQLAIPVRVKVCGRSQTPAIDQVLALFDKKIVLNRLQSA